MRKPARRHVMRVKPVKRGWKLTNAGIDRAVDVFPKKMDALAVGRSIAQQIWREGGLAQVVVHGKDGKIQKEWTYGRDPRRFPG